MENLKCYLIIHNVAKNHNVGTIVRSAAAMNVSEIWVAGKRKLASFGNQGTAKRLVYRNFGNLSDLKQYSVSHQIQILGLEILESSKSIWDSPFTTSTAFIMGNEGIGMTDQEKEICDGFVYIPQYNSNTESLNVSVAVGILLNHYSRTFYIDWAGFIESKRIGEKFEVSDKTGIAAMMSRAEEIREERKKKSFLDKQL
jgi:tRNA G18 (ribose-2'-O)-methylase SpoU